MKYLQLDWVDLMPIYMISHAPTSYLEMNKWYTVVNMQNKEKIDGKQGGCEAVLNLKIVALKCISWSPVLGEHFKLLIFLF